MMGGVGGLIETELYAGARYDLVAEALGCHGELVEQPEQLRPALERAQESGLPALIQVMVHPDANLAPPGLLVFGSMVYRAED
jgi:acetolactate synthase-1/2/3 large subunit